MVLILAIAQPAAGQTGLLVVAHGAGPDWNGRVRETVAQVSWPHGPIATAFLMGAEAGTAGWNQAMDRLVAEGASSIIAVPLMVSSHGEHHQQIRYFAGELAEPPPALAAHGHTVVAPPAVPVHVTAALDAAPELGAALQARWGVLDSAGRSRPVLLVAHGPTDATDAARWIADLGAASQGIPAEVRIGLLRDDAPRPVRDSAVAQLRDTVAALGLRHGDSVVVMPVMISTGDITKVKIPRDLDGLPIHYLPAPITPLPPLARWIERVADEARAQAATTRAQAEGLTAIQEASGLR